MKDGKGYIVGITEELKRLFNYGWKHSNRKDGIILESEGYGEYRHCMVRRTPCCKYHDKVIFVQHPSVVAIVRRKNKWDTYKYALIKNHRSVLTLENRTVHPDEVELEQLGEYLWEFPGGMIDVGETPADAALREGYEETGWHTRDPQELGWFYPDAGLNTTKIPIFLVEATEENGKGLDVDDGIVDIQWVTFEQLHKMEKIGEIQNGHTCNALMKLYSGHMAGTLEV